MVRAPSLRCGLSRKASDQRGIDAAFAALAQQGAGALIVSSDDFFAQAIDQLVALAARHRVPVIYDRREFTAAGGLMSYGLPNIFDAWRQVGAYTGRILKGEKPADLPVQQSAKIGMIFNMKTAKALGLAVPQSILLRADEVIE
jgi:putative tryptophan/tyrosine transport system substrate-binding protein